MHAEQTRQVPCPACETLLTVPPGSAGKFARCGQCQHRFQIPDQSASQLSDDDVLTLLGGQEDEVDLETESQLDELTDSGMSTFAADSGAPVGTMRILKIRANGVLVDFPAEYLLDEHSRCAMPRTCMCCGTRANLMPHLIRFIPREADTSVAGLQQQASLALKDPALARLDNVELLQKLPEVPDALPPANHPTPYWLCDQCRDVGVVAGQIKVDPDTQQGTCWLFVRDPRRCEEFVRAAAGDNVPGLDKLHELNESGKENPWDLVPESVQHRLQQWYRPDRDEQFLGYAPNRAHNRTEDGMAGILVSNKRLIFHSQRRHMESKADEPLKLLLAMTRDAGELEINTPTWEIKRMKVDREGIRVLRRALTMGKFRVSWK